MPDPLQRSFAANSTTRLDPTLTFGRRSLAVASVLVRYLSVLCSGLLSECPAAVKCTAGQAGPTASFDVQF